MGTRWAGAETQGDAALTATVARTVVLVRKASMRNFSIISLGVSFDGVETTDEPVTVEFCRSSGSTSGTSSAGNSLHVGGVPGIGGASTRFNFTVEPTVITVLKRWLVRPDGGGFDLSFPQGREMVTDAQQDLLIRCTAPQAVNVQAYMILEFLS